MSGIRDFFAYAWHFFVCSFIEIVMYCACIVSNCPHISDKTCVILKSEISRIHINKQEHLCKLYIIHILRFVLEEGGE